MALDSDSTQVAIVTEDETSTLDTKAVDQELAWSVDPDAHTEVAITPTSRSWTVPIGLIALAVAASITTGAIAMWPHHSTPKTPTAQAVTHRTPAEVSAPILMTPADKLFTDSLKNYGFHDHTGRPPAEYNADTIATGHVICEILNTGEPVDLTVQMIHNKYPDLTMPQTQILVDDAIAAYCPKYQS